MPRPAKPLCGCENGPERELRAIVEKLSLNKSGMDLLYGLNTLSAWAFWALAFCVFYSLSFAKIVKIDAFYGSLVEEEFFSFTGDKAEAFVGEFFDSALGHNVSILFKINGNHPSGTAPLCSLSVFAGICTLFRNLFIFSFLKR